MKTPNRTPGETPERTPDAVPAAGDGGHDAVALLKSDHRSVEALFEKYEAATSASEKAELVANICRELIVHTVLEEELFYPACRAAKVERGELDEAQVEHDSAKVLTAELMMEKPDAAYFDAKVKVLSEYIKLHVGEEENPGEGIFARALAAGVDMHALGEKLQARKSRLLEWMESPEFDPPSPRSLHVMIARKHSQESKAMPRYSKDLERDERGRFVKSTRLIVAARVIATITTIAAGSMTTARVTSLASSRAMTTGVGTMTVIAKRTGDSSVMMNTAACIRRVRDMGGMMAMIADRPSTDRGTRAGSPAETTAAAPRAGMTTRTEMAGVARMATPAAMRRRPTAAGSTVIPAVTRRVAMTTAAAIRYLVGAATMTTIVVTAAGTATRKVIPRPRGEAGGIDS